MNLMEGPEEQFDQIGSSYFGALNKLLSGVVDRSG